MERTSERMWMHALHVLRGWDGRRRRHRNNDNDQQNRVCRCGKGLSKIKMHHTSNVRCNPHMNARHMMAIFGRNIWKQKQPSACVCVFSAEAAFIFNNNKRWMFFHTTKAFTTHRLNLNIHWNIKMRKFSKANQMFVSVSCANVNRNRLILLIRRSLANAAIKIDRKTPTNLALPWRATQIK